MVTDEFWGLFADVEIDCLHSLFWRSETECNVALYMHALMAAIMPLHHVKIG